MGTKQAKKLGNVVDHAGIYSVSACPTEWPGALLLRLCGSTQVLCQRDFVLLPQNFMSF